VAEDPSEQVIVMQSDSFLQTMGKGSAGQFSTFGASNRSHTRTFLLGTFPWTDALAAFDDVNETIAYSQVLLDKLTTSLIQEPLKSFIDQCQPPPLIVAEDIDCSNYLTAFTGIKRQVCAQMVRGAGNAGLIALPLID
jgi:hypothetical protein